MSNYEVQIYRQHFDLMCQQRFVENVKPVSPNEMQACEL
jgi:hypothetical protein